MVRRRSLGCRCLSSAVDSPHPRPLFRRFDLFVTHFSLPLLATPDPLGALYRPGRKPRRTLTSTPGGGQPYQGAGDGKPGAPPADDFFDPSGPQSGCSLARQNRVKHGRDLGPPGVAGGQEIGLGSRDLHPRAEARATGRAVSEERLGDWDGQADV